VHVTTLGPLALDGRPVRGERLAAVVRELVAARGRAVSVGALVEAVWDGAPPDDEQGAVQALVSRVRRLGLPVQSVPGGYRLPADDLSVDSDEARGLVGVARAALEAGDLVAAADAAAQARALLPPAPDDAAAVRLLAEAADVTARVALRTDGPYDETDLRLLATRTPPDEPSVALLVRVLAAQGRDAEALEVVETLRRDLAERYGTDPSAVVAHAHVALLRGELGPTRAPDGGRPAAAPTVGPPVGSSTAAAHTLDAAGRSTAPTAHLPSAWRRPPTPLVGREADVAAVTAALRDAAVVTVVATGGAGKTRLAAEVARLAAEAGQQVHVVELAGLRSADDVLPAVIGELGGSETVPALPEVGVERRVLPRLERLRAAAQELRGLVVLDNCEHVLAAAADLVADLLDVVPPDVTILATSRAPLGLVGERVHRLPALPDTDALALLRARAESARPGLVWDDERALELCHRLDSLPLALELAAARLRSMPLEDLLDSLADRFALLDDALRGLPERHASLWALVDWSRELLPDDERELLARLAVVPGSFTAALAASVAGVPDTRRGLADLVDQSLLVLDDAGPGPARYRMLETVREYGEARLDAAGTRADAMAGLVAWATREAVDLSDRMTGEGQLDAFARCSDEQEALVAALRWSIEHDEAAAVEVASALFPWWTVRGMHVEVVTWASRLVHVSEPAARRRSALFVGAASGRRVPHGELTTTVMLQTAVNGGITTTLRLTALAGRVLRRLAREQSDEVRPGSAALAAAVPSLVSTDLAALEDSARSLTAQDDEYVQALGLFLRAAVRENAGETDGSAQDARAAFTMFERIGNHWGMGMAAQGVAQWSAAHGGDDAVEWLERSVHHLELVGAVQDARSLRVLLDVQRAVEGDQDGRAALHDVVTSPREEAMDRAQALLGLAMVALSDGDTASAVTHALRAVQTVADDESSVPQARIVFRVSAVVLLLQAERDETDPARRAAVDADVVAALTAAITDARGLSDMPVVGAFALGCAELVAWRGDDEDTAVELWALGTRMGASVSSIALQVGKNRSLASSLAGTRGQARADELRPRPASEISRSILALASRLLGPATQR